MKQATKSKVRLELLDIVSEALTHEEIFNTINYKNQSEEQIKQFTYPYIVDALTNYIHERKGGDKVKAREFVKKNLKWEGNVNTTVHHTLFMGTMNRPDMVLEMNGLNIAIEFKRGESGGSLRSGLGQSLIYSTNYDFVLYLFIDISRDGKIKNCSKSIKEDKLVEDLWNRYNIKFIVV
tara:strand:- start:468 stop:1004 length:537 start_codon:yes stop_codon:yes gene_type:complete